MKLRAIVALLFVVALVALVLVRSGSNRQEAEVTKGSPFTGLTPVTRSVAWIEARQRRLDRQPEAASPETPAESQAAADEAAREPAAGEPAGTNVREKPEPGEETGPPRRAVSAAPQQSSGRSAIGPKSSFSEGTAFLGADSNDSGFIPPDSMGAVGPTQILV